MCYKDDVGRKLRSNIAKFKDELHHPKAIRTLRDAMTQAVKLEWEQKFTNLQDTEIMNISPDNSPQNSKSECNGAEIDAIYSDRRYKSQQHRNWDNNKKWNFDNRWQNKGRYNNYNIKDGYHKLRFENSKKGGYDNKSNNKTHPKQYTQDALNELIELAITHALQKNNTEGCEWS